MPGKDAEGGGHERAVRMGREGKRKRTERRDGGRRVRFTFSATAFEM